MTDVIKLAESKVQVADHIYDFATGLAAQSFVTCMQSHDLAYCLAEHPPVDDFPVRQDLDVLAGDGAG
ncbi:hypothetical protein JCM19000A_23140 [Silvimonas sp. JCM 19000]